MAKSAYIHIPFCSHKCDFCDFAAFAGLDDLVADYCKVLRQEISERLAFEPNQEKLATVFFGGGTPGYIDAQYLSDIIIKLSETCGIEADAEITLETTPQAVSTEKAKSWLEFGIKRLSIGIESLNDNELKAMGRDHSCSQAIEGVKNARKAGYRNLALDLIYGLPEQTLESFEHTLDTLFELEPEHLSAYGLTIAVNSPLLLRYPLDSKAYPDEVSFGKMYYLLLEKCKKAGLEQYEIANFAKPGFESRHNLTYWQNREYLAFGVSAHRYYRARRSSNFRSLKRYMREFTGVESEDKIDSRLRAQESVFLGLRLRSGLDLSNFQEEHGFDLAKEKEAAISELERLGYLTLEAGVLKLTHEGVLVSNTVLAELI